MTFPSLLLSKRARLALGLVLLISSAVVAGYSGSLDQNKAPPVPAAEKST